MADRPVTPAGGPEVAPAPAALAVGPTWATLPAEQAARKFINDNPKLVASETGKRGARRTDKTFRRLRLGRVAAVLADCAVDFDH